MLNQNQNRQDSFDDILLPRIETMHLMSDCIEQPKDDLTLLSELDQKIAEGFIHKDSESPARLARQMEAASNRFHPVQ